MITSPLESEIATFMQDTLLIPRDRMFRDKTSNVCGTGSTLITVPAGPTRSERTFVYIPKFAPRSTAIVPR